jgi:hypothetical protein
MVLPNLFDSYDFRQHRTRPEGRPEGEGPGREEDHARRGRTETTPDHTRTRPRGGTGKEGTDREHTQEGTLDDTEKKPRGINTIKDHRRPTQSRITKDKGRAAFNDGITTS